MLDRIFKNLPTVTKNLLIINVLFFILSAVLGRESGGIVDSLALRFPTSEDFRPWQIITHFFMHAGLGHIFFNMFALLMFGSQLERVWGPKRFLTFYFICALGSAGLHTAWSGLELNNMQNDINAFEQAPSLDGFTDYFNGYLTHPQISETIDHLQKDPNDRATVEQAVAYMEGFRTDRLDVPVLGASGAIYGLLLAFGMLFPNVELMLLFFPMPIKAKYFIPGLIAIELFMGFNNFSWDNTAHFAHLGGALIGFIMVKIWQKRRDTFY